LRSPRAAQYEPAMTKLISLFAALAFVAGCSKGFDTSKISSLKDEACACKDKKCADEVNKKLEDTLDEMAKSAGGKEPDEATQKQFTTLMGEAAICLAKHEK
jgi:hypothetical protein